MHGFKRLLTPFRSGESQLMLIHSIETPESIHTAFKTHFSKPEPSIDDIFRPLQALAIPGISETELKEHIHIRLKNSPTIFLINEC